MELPQLTAQLHDQRDWVAAWPIRLPSSFAELSRRRHEPLLRAVSGTVRFDIDSAAGTDHWLVAVRRSDISLTCGDGPADAVYRTDRALFDRVVCGQASGLTSVLRGAASMSGDMELLVYAWRLFPGPARQAAGA